MLKCTLITVFLLLLVSSSMAGTAIAPSTTLTAETSNNTSASNDFVASANGNAATGNISKESLKKLLPAGSPTRIFAHFMPWFGGYSHLNVGYSSNDQGQVKRQIDDMMSRGIDGVIIDWYGPDKSLHNQTSLYIKQDAETRGGKFEFAIVEDEGAVRTCATTLNCDVTQKVIDDLNYINLTFASSPAYMRVNGKPVIFSFDLETVAAIDWARVMANVQGNPMIVFRNNSGFQRPYSSGSYAWVSINKANPEDWAQKYLDSFYLTSRSYAAMLSFPAVWKGFNDNGALWGQNRVMNQNCGQVWLSTFNEMNKYFSSSSQAFGVQIATWNDYEEGTEIETGIDNCVSIAGAVSGTDLTWVVKGQENTIDHYTVFASLDGENLMPLADVPAGVNQLSLSNFQLPQGNYSLYVKVVGKPSLTNKMSSAIPFTVLNIPPVAAVNVSAESGTAPVTVTVSTASSFDPDGKIASSKIDFGDGTVVVGSTGLHTYTAAGRYIVTATVTDNGNAAASATTSVVVKENIPPAAAITVTPASGITPTTVTACTAASKDSDGTIASSAIDFGDGTVVPGPTASHVYSTAGVFVVKALVTDNGGLSAITSTAVSIAAPIQFSVKASSPADGSTVNSRVRFVATTTSPSPVISMRIYVDGVSAYSSSVGTLDTTLTLAPGIRNVVLQAWNANGQIVKTSMRLTVLNAAPTVSLSATPSSGIAPIPVTLTVVSSDLDGFIKSTTLDFGDGAIGYSGSTTHTYSIPGVYNITAKVTDNNGATTSTSTTVTVKPTEGVVILTPRTGETTGTAVEVSAFANAPTSIKAVRLYVDSRAVFSTGDPSIDTFLALRVGTHQIVVQAWDSLGKVYKATTAITVK